MPGSTAAEKRGAVGWYNGQTGISIFSQDGNPARGGTSISRSPHGSLRNVIKRQFPSTFKILVIVCVLTNRLGDHRVDFHAGTDHCRRRLAPTFLAAENSIEMTDLELAAERLIDVRTIAPADRHPRIFGVATAPGEGTSFIIVNDHDPRSLRHQIEAKYPGVPRARAGCLARRNQQTAIVRLRLLLRRLMTSPTSGSTLQASFFAATDWSRRRPDQTFETSKARRVPRHENVAEG